MPDNNLCDTPQPTLQSVLNRTGKDKFLLVLNLPEVLKKQSILNDLINLDPLQISIFGTVVPQIQVPANEVRFAGQSYNVTSYTRPNYSPLTVSFVIDNKFYNYWLLWKWLSILNSPTGSLYDGTDPRFETFRDRLQAGNLTEYQTNFSVIGLNEYNDTTIEFIYRNAFITSLGAISYSYRDPEIIESSAEFQFSQLDVKLQTQKTT
jgi:hypothetical protein